MLFCPGVVVLKLYDAGLYPNVTIFPVYEVISDAVGGKWRWKATLNDTKRDISWTNPRTERNSYGNSSIERNSLKWYKHRTQLIEMVEQLDADPT